MEVDTLEVRLNKQPSLFKLLKITCRFIVCKWKNTGSEVLLFLSPKILNFRKCFVFFRPQNKEVFVRQYGQGVWFPSVCQVWLVHSVCDATEKCCWCSMVSVITWRKNYNCFLLQHNESLCWNSCYISK